MATMPGNVDVTYSITYRLAGEIYTAHFSTEADRDDFAGQLRDITEVDILRITAEVFGVRIG
jgi:hypothetical protein